MARDRRGRSTARVRVATAWGLALCAALLALLALLPGAWPGLDAGAAALPAAPALALLALVIARTPGPRIVALATIATAVIPNLQAVTVGDKSSVDDRTLTIVTHNVSIGNSDPAGTVAALAASDSDVLLLQETDGRIAPYLARLRARYPYSNSCRQGCSTAIFSRWPMTRARWRFRDSLGETIGPGLVQSRIRLPWGGEAAIASVHLSRREPAGARARARQELAEAVRHADMRRLVIGGDFNLSPWGAAMRRLDAAMRPLCRATRATFSFPATWNGHAVPFPLVPIDHIYAGPGWGVAAVHRMPKTGSDHYPIRVVLVPRSSKVC